MFHYVHSSLIYYTQKLDRTQMSLNRRMDAEKCGYRMEYNSGIKNNDFNNSQANGWNWKMSS